MLAHAIYYVISAEGLRRHLVRDAGMAKEAAQALKLNSAGPEGVGLIDAIIPEPPGGAHADPTLTAALLDSVLKRQLEELRQVSTADRLRARYLKFRKMGSFAEEPT